MPIPMAEVVAEVKPPGVAWEKGSPPELPPQADPVLEINPTELNVAQPAVPPAEETMRLVVEARPVLSTENKVDVPYVLVVEPIANSMVGTVKAALVLAISEKLAHGEVVPIPTLPALLTRKVVEEAVDDPMTNWLAASPAVGLMANEAQGVEEAIPKLPAFVIVSAAGVEVAYKSVDVPR